MYAQTQTKIYKFSDKGIEINGSAKGYYPVAFKKIFTTGYNETSVSNIEVFEGKVTIILPTNHGFLLERVIRFTSGNYTKDYFLTEVTSTSISFYDEDFPNQFPDPISIKYAPLDWELVYEVGQVHIYKFKDLDDSDLYLRLFYLSPLNNSTLRGLVYPCVGRAYDPDTGYITDPDSLTETRDIKSGAQRFSWEIGQYTDVYYDKQPLSSSLGTVTIIGSLYHMVMSTSTSTTKNTFHLATVLPVANCVQDKALPLLVGSRQNYTSSGPSQTFSNCYMYVNNTRVCNYRASSDIIAYFGMPSYIPDPWVSSLGVSDRFSLNGITLYFAGTSSYFGNALGAHYLIAKTSDNRFPNSSTSYPLGIMDTDNFIKSYLCPNSDGSTFSGYVVPMEEIHLGYKV